MIRDAEHDLTKALAALPTGAIGAMISADERVLAGAIDAALPRRLQYRVLAALCVLARPELALPPGELRFLDLMVRSAIRSWQASISNRSA